MGRSRWLIPALASLLVHCGSEGSASLADARADLAVEVASDDVTDGGTDLGDDTPTAVDLPPPDVATDEGPLPDLVPAEDVIDAAPPSDLAAPPDLPALDAALVDLPDALDVPSEDVVVLPDITLIEDIPMPFTDVAPVDVAPSRDAGPMCPNGLNDTCPTTVPGPCPTLVSGMSQVVRFTGLTANISSSCEGSLTRNGRDGVVPLTITAPSDVSITAQPTGSDVVVLALYRATGCGQSTGELRCANGSSFGSTARVSATSLEPGTYFVAVTALLGNPVMLQANVNPARPRRRGDVCPGVPITPDAPATTLSTSGFQSAADYGTSCGAGSTSSAWVDAVFSYTLTAARDVTLSVSASGSGDLAVDVSPACGARAAAIPPCQSGSMIRRVLRNQQPGTWYVTVDHRATSSGRTISASVTTATPTPTDPADRCPGVALTENVATTIDATTLGGDAALSCVRAQRSDGYFALTAPAADRDVLVNVRGNGTDAVGFALQSACGMATVGGCSGTADRAPANVWARYRGLTPGNTYTVAAGTAQSTGSLSVRYLSIPAATPVPSMNGNTSCARATVIPAEGGLFTGSTSNGERVFSVQCGVAACIGSRHVYYRLTLAERRRVVINTAGSGFDTFVNVLSGDCPGRPVDGACNDDAIGTAAMVDTTLDAGSYVVMLGGCGAGAQGTYALDVALLAP